MGGELGWVGGKRSLPHLNQILPQLRPQRAALQRESPRSRYHHSLAPVHETEYGMQLVKQLQSVQRTVPLRY